ncbi:MAG TPA: isocitrate/isopropylmalate family dehydrogenase, partial [Burkholderiales bacterium]|nr:isocitrate/isopropylmalate family dehydrogenase [Burkholderiales bacterium]
GPEITAAAVAVLERANAVHGLGLTFVQREVGVESWKRVGTTLPDAIVDEALAADAVVLGPCGMTEYPPREEGGINVPGTIRKRLDLYANIRPARTRPGIPKGLPNLDCLIVRENTEGFYSDRNMFLGSGEFMPTEDLALSVRKITAKASKRIAQVAFDYATRRRKQVSAVGKRHVLQLSDGIFIKQASLVAEQFPQVTWREMDIDAMAADLYTRPERHDVILITNMFGDVLSNLAVAMSGSLGLAAALNAGDKHLVANAGHGSAPDIAGKDMGNPTGLILSTAMLLDALGNRHGRAELTQAGAAIEAAVDAVLANPTQRTADLGGKTGTRAFGAAVVAQIEKSAKRIAQPTA